MSTTRSGVQYKMATDDTTRPQPHTTEIGARTDMPGTDLTVFMQMFLQDRQQLEMELVEEHRRRDHDMEEWVQEMQHQMAELCTLATTRVRTEDSVKLTKLLATDDIEVYLTTFERLMRAYEIPETCWALKLALQLTGPAQQAYTAMDQEEAADYQAVKAAIFHRYEITEQTYRQQFRTLKRKNGRCRQSWLPVSKTWQRSG